MKDVNLTIEWKKREEMYSKNYNHSTIDVAGTFYGILQQLRMLALLKESKGSVLDVGCADSPLLTWFAETRNSLVVGVDVVIPPKIPEAKWQRCNFVSGVAEYLPFRTNSFDTVVMGEVIEHVIDLQKVFAEACRVSRFKILLSTPNRISNPLAKFSPDHLRSFSYGTLSDFLSSLHLSMKFVKQPIFPPLPPFVHRFFYVWARERYVVRGKRPREGTLKSQIIRAILRSLEEMSRIFPSLSTTFVVSLEKASSTTGVSSQGASCT